MDETKVNHFNFSFVIAEGDGVTATSYNEPFYRSVVIHENWVVKRK